MFGKVYFYSIQSLQLHKCAQSYTQDPIVQFSTFLRLWSDCYVTIIGLYSAKAIHVYHRSVSSFQDGVSLDYGLLGSCAMQSSTYVLEEDAVSIFRVVYRCSIAWQSFDA